MRETMKKIARAGLAFVGPLRAVLPEPCGATGRAAAAFCLVAVSARGQAGLLVGLARGEGAFGTAKKNATP